MRTQETLRARVVAAIEDLDRVVAQLYASRGEETWYHRAIADLRREVVEVRQKLADDQQLAQAGGASREAWIAFTNHSREAEAVIEESRALLEGMLARQAGLDDHLCRLADGLLIEIARTGPFSWNRFTILGRGEMYADLAQVIRVRYPSAGVWDLPIAAHEFGHYVGNRDLSVRLESAMARERVQRGSADWYHWHEFFADAFATCASGPAYACACIALRFEPRAQPSAELARTHPSDLERAIVVLRILQLLERRTNGEYAGFVELLARLWQESLDSASQPAVPDELRRVLVDRASELYDIMAESKPGLLYGSWARAMRIRSLLEKAAVGASDVPDDTALGDVLNAAWYARMTSATPLDTVATAARLMSEVVIGRAERAEARP